MTVFVNPYTWSPNELVTATKLNYLGAYLTTYLNGNNISPSQLSTPYSNQMLQYNLDVPAGGGFLAAPFLNYFIFLLPAANWNFTLEKFAITAWNIVGAGAAITADIGTIAGGVFASVLSGAAPVAVASLTEASNTNPITLTSGTQYAVKVSAVGTGVQAYSGVCISVFGKMFLRG